MDTERTDNSTPLAPKQRECPNCQARLPVDPGYITWCEHCGWNVQPENARRPRTIFESFYLSTGRQLSERLFAELNQATSFEPRWTSSKLLALLVAGSAHLFTLALALLGIVLIAWNWPNPFLIASGSFGMISAIVAGVRKGHLRAKRPTSGLLCLGLVWMLFPRFAPMPATAAQRDEFPTLYAFTDQIARTIDAEPVR